MLYFNVEPVNTDKEEGCVSLSLNTPEIGSQEIHDQISLPEKKGKVQILNLVLLFACFYVWFDFVF